MSKLDRQRKHAKRLNKKRAKWMEREGVLIYGHRLNEETGKMESFQRLIKPRD